MISIHAQIPLFSARGSASALVEKVAKSLCNQCHPKEPEQLNSLQIITHGIKLELNTNKNKELLTTIATELFSGWPANFSNKSKSDHVSHFGQPVISKKEHLQYLGTARICE